MAGINETDDAVHNNLTPSWTPLLDILDTISQFKIAVTVEASYLIGGLRSLISEIIVQHGLNCQMINCGIRKTPNGLCGSQNYIYDINGLTGEKIAEAVKRKSTNNWEEK